MSPGPGPLAELVVWGTLAGLDLVSVLQGMLARPLVAGTVSGWLLGDLGTGLRIGAALELFALDVLPIGAARYPDLAAATVGAVTAAAGAGWSRVLGASVGLGLVLGLVGGVSLPLVRRLNARALRAHAAGLTSGDPAAVRAVHLRGLAHDLGRSLVLALLAVAAGVALRGWTLLDQVTGEWLTATAVAGGLYAAAHGAVATVRQRGRLPWLLAGLSVGLLLLTL